MKQFVCDYEKCKKIIGGGEPNVVLIGNRVYDKHFCDSDCFWKWTLELIPEYITSGST